MHKWVFKEALPPHYTHCSLTHYLVESHSDSGVHTSPLPLLPPEGRCTNLQVLQVDNILEQSSFQAFSVSLSPSCVLFFAVHVCHLPLPTLTWYQSKGSRTALRFLEGEEAAEQINVFYSREAVDGLCFFVKKRSRRSCVFLSRGEE